MPEPKHEAVFSKPIGKVDQSTKSILVTGGLKFENGVLYQQVDILIHKAHDGLEVGLRTGQWIPVPSEFMDEVKMALLK